MAQMAERVATNSELQRLSPRPGSKLDRTCNLLSGGTFGIEYGDINSGDGCQIARHG